MAENEKYLAPRTLDKAAQGAARQDATILAGGTDLLPRWSKGLLQRPEALISLKDVAGLEGVGRANGEIRIGACTTMTEIASDAIIRDAAPALADAAGRIACPQVRNRATIGGNLCNASPAADTAVPLILLDAVLELASWERSSLDVREVSVADFFTGPGATVLAPGELLTHIRFKPLHGAESPRERERKPEPAAVGGVFAAWDKFGTRPAMEIAVASVGVAIKVEGGIIKHARVGYGSVAPIPLRGLQAEAQLLGSKLCEATIDKCVAAGRDEIAPITDVRAGAAYRREIVGVMLRRMLENAGRD